MSALESEIYWEQSSKSPRYADRKRLLRFGWKAYSQNEEDGILREIFRRIGEGKRAFIEIGAGEGLENNTAALLLAGWRGLWLEAHTPSMDAIRRMFADQVNAQQLLLANHFVSRSNVNEILRVSLPEAEPDLLSIDVDGNDYWLWGAIERMRPRVVVIEYNATWHPPLSIAVRYEEAFQWDGSNYFGASLKALERLGRRKGYSLVGCCFAGVNAFFVRDDLCHAHFRKPYTAENHYEPPRYYMIRPAGHRPGMGPVETIDGEGAGK